MVGTVCRGCKVYFGFNPHVPYHEHQCCSVSCFYKVGPIGNRQCSRLLTHLTPPAPKPGKGDKKRRIKKQRRTEPRRAARRRKTRQELSNEFYASRDWLELRYRVLKKYGPKCMLCGSSHPPMHIDHIKPRSKYPALELDFDNLQVLCAECNRGKSNKDSSDFRPPTV